MSSLGDAIKGARQAKGLSRADLALRAGISHVFVGKIEQGERRPSPPTLRSISRVLGMTVSELTTRAEVLNISQLTTGEELIHGLIRTVTMSARASPAIARMGFGAAGAVDFVAIAAGAYLRFRQQRAGDGSRPSRELSAKERLQALVEQLSEAEAKIVLDAIDPDGVGMGEPL